MKLGINTAVTAVRDALRNITPANGYETAMGENAFGGWARPFYSSNRQTDFPAVFVAPLALPEFTVERPLTAPREREGQVLLTVAVKVTGHDDKVLAILEAALRDLRRCLFEYRLTLSLAGAEAPVCQLLTKGGGSFDHPTKGSTVGFFDVELVLRYRECDGA
jgi:hypothetical protein